MSATSVRMASIQDTDNTSAGKGGRMEACSGQREPCRFPWRMGMQADTAILEGNLDVP